MTIDGAAETAGALVLLLAVLLAWVCRPQKPEPTKPPAEVLVPPEPQGVVLDFKALERRRKR